MFAEDAAPAEDSLQNMAWWDTVDYRRDVQEFIPTVAAVPPTVVAAVAEACVAIPLETPAQVAEAEVVVSALIS